MREVVLKLPLRAGEYEGTLVDILDSRWFSFDRETMERLKELRDALRDAK